MQPTERIATDRLGADRTVASCPMISHFRALALCLLCVSAPDLANCGVSPNSLGSVPELSTGSARFSSLRGTVHAQMSHAPWMTFGDPLFIQVVTRFPSRSPTFPCQALSSAISYENNLNGDYALHMILISIVTWPFNDRLQSQTVGVVISSSM